MKLVETVAQLLARKGHEVWSVPPGATVLEALAVLAKRGIGAVLVMENDHLLGILSERDYARKVVLRGRSSRETRVEEIMISPVVTVGPDQRVQDCLELMAAGRFRHLPVLEKERVIGVVSVGDLVNSIISSQEKAIDQLEDFISGKYPG